MSKSRSSSFVNPNSHRRPNGILTVLRSRSIFPSPHSPHGDSANMPPTPVLLFLLTALIRSSSAACYYPNGTDVTTYRSENNAYAPCNASAQESMCCRINLSPDSSKDHCRSDGLCDSPNHVYLWRESCTDPTWKSPHCQRLCLDYAGKQQTLYIDTGGTDGMTRHDGRESPSSMQV